MQPNGRQRQYQVDGLEDTALTDRELLGEYAREGSDAAFEEIARRYAPLVYSQCARRLGDEHAAEDAAQATFLALARKARRLSRKRGLVLSAWLYRAAELSAKAQARAERRRARREREAAEMRSRSAPRSEGDAWRDVGPVVDDCMAALPAKYRDVLVLRHLAGRPEKEVAEELGKPVGTVKSLLSRGLAKLRAKLQRRGVSVGGAALAAVLASEAAQAAPVHIAATVAAVGTGKAAASGAVAAITEGAMKAMLVAKLKVAAAVVAVTALAGTGTGVMIAKAQEGGPRGSGRATPAATHDPFTVAGLRFAVRKPHPRFWLTPERLAVLRAKARRNSPDFRLLKAFADQWYFSRKPTGGGWGRDETPSLALLWHATGERKYLEKAKEFLLGIARKKLHSSLKGNAMRHGGVYLPLSFDWLYNELTEAERRECVAEIIRGLEAIKPGTIGMRTFDGDQMTGEWSAAVLSALAIYGHDDSARKWLEHYLGDAPQWKIEKQYVLNSRGGFGREGSGYSVGTLQYSLLAREGLKTAAGADVWKGLLPDDGDFPAQVAYWLIYGCTPVGPGPIMYGDLEKLGDKWWRRPSDSAWPLSAMTQALLPRSGREAGYMRHHIDAVLGNAKAMRPHRFFLSYDDTVPPRNYTKELATDYFATGQGFLVARSDWTPEATLVTFQCTNAPMDHTHPDQGSFMLYRKGWWLTKEFTSYTGWGGRPEAHNVMLLWNLGAPRPAAKMLAFRPTEHYVYAVASASGSHRTHGWQPPKGFVRNYTRSIIYLKPDLLAILDRSDLLGRPDKIDTAKQYVQTHGAGGQKEIAAAKHSREFVLHLPVRPETSEGSSLLTARHAEARQVLYAKTLLPAEVACEVVDLKPKLDEAYGPKNNAAAPLVERASWMVRTSSAKDPDDAGVFLTVLYGADAGAPMIPLKALRKGTKVGFEATAGDATYSVLFETAGEDGAEVKVERRGRAVCDDRLRPGIDWTPPWKRP